MQRAHPPGLADASFDVGKQKIIVDRLDEIVVCSGSRAGNHLLALVERGEKHEGDVVQISPPLAYRLEYLIAVHARHRDVAENQIGPDRIEQVDRAWPVGSADRFMTGGSQLLDDIRAQFRLVFDAQDQAPGLQLTGQARHGCLSPHTLYLCCSFSAEEQWTTASSDAPSATRGNT